MPKLDEVMTGIIFFSAKERLVGELPLKNLFFCKSNGEVEVPVQSDLSYILVDDTHA